MGKDAAGTVYSSSSFWGRVLESFPASYTVWKDTSTSPATYRAECNVKGGTDYSGTDAATVIQAVIDALTSGGKIFIKAGEYAINSVVDCGSTSYLKFEGESWAAKLLIGANGGFKFGGASGGFVYGVTFRNLMFDGQGSASYAIKSYDDNVKILDDWTIENCHFTNFYASGAIALKLGNLERSRINNNRFSVGTRTAWIKLFNQGTYSSGNVAVVDNFFNIPYDNDDAIAVHIFNSVENKGMGNIKIRGNHFYSSGTYNGLGVKVEVTTGDDVKWVKVTENRCEYTDLINATGSSSGYVYKCIIAHNTAYNDKASSLIYLNGYAKRILVSDNILQVQNSSGKQFEDLGNASTEPNIFVSNNIQGTGTPDFNQYTEVRNNYGLNPLGEVSENIRNTANTKITYKGVYKLANDTAYQISNTDCYITVEWVDGTVDVYLIAPDGTTEIKHEQLTASGKVTVFAPYQFYFKIVYTITRPTVKAYWC